MTSSWSCFINALARSGSRSLNCSSSRTLTASATRCCCAPSCRLRSMRRRSASAAATNRPRDACNSAACPRSCSRESCSDESRCAFFSATPSSRANSSRVTSTSAARLSPLRARSATTRPKSCPLLLTGAIRRVAWPRPSDKAGSHTLTHAALETCAFAAIVSSAGLIGTGFLSFPGSAAASRRLPASQSQSSAASSLNPSFKASTIWSRSSSIGTPRLSWLANELRTKSMADRLATSRRRRATAVAAPVASAISRIATTSAARRTFGPSWLRSGTSGCGASVLQAQGFGRTQAGGAQGRRDRHCQYRQIDQDNGERHG